LRFLSDLDFSKELRCRSQRFIDALHLLAVDTGAETDQRLFAEVKMAAEHQETKRRVFFDLHVLDHVQELDMIANLNDPCLDRLSSTP
jgi:hypothetical protein